jgi:hypothetical protein
MIAVVVVTSVRGRRRQRCLVRRALGRVVGALRGPVFGASQSSSTRDAEQHSEIACHAKGPSKTRAVCLVRREVPIDTSRTPRWRLLRRGRAVRCLGRVETPRAPSPHRATACLLTPRAAQTLDDARHVVGHWLFEMHGFAGARVFEAELEGVQH